VRPKNVSYYSGPQRRQERMTPVRQNQYQNQSQKRMEDVAAGGNNYDGPGTGSYLGRRGVQATPAAVPKEDFDIQSNNARFNKDQFKEQVVAAQKKDEPIKQETPQQTNTTPQQTESSELNDLLKKLKSDKPTHLSPSAQPFVPASESKKDIKENKETKSIEGVPAPDNFPIAPKYEKKNFFDDISTDRDVSQRRDMVKRDTETFGDIAANYGYYNRQRSRYFNAGGGRGRGGGQRQFQGRGGQQQRRGNNPNPGAGAGYGTGAPIGTPGSYYRAVQRV